MNQIIKVYNINENTADFELYESNQQNVNKMWKTILKTKAYIGKNGVTINKEEGDLKTPLGTFELGIAFGTHTEEEVKTNLEYIKINENLHWVDDINSKYYNQLVDARKVEKDWKSSEHLSDYSKQYEYAIEIKTNPNNIKGKGSAIFLHCDTGNATAGCVAINREKMLELLKKLQKNAIICIEK
jgi:L,D-peptidoglycan transpeptidase YkuD (ErfK/YbiS/YcfS/YnhG family)